MSNHDPIPVGGAQPIRPTLEFGGSSEGGPCPCCGHRSRKVWGYVHRGVTPEAAYFVHWTLDRVREHGAHFDLILGKWGEGSMASDRHAVSLEFRWLQTGPSFRIIDAAGRPVLRSPLVGRALGREEVIGTRIAENVFMVVDEILAIDERIAELNRGPDAGTSRILES